jgi:hypothetical protein
MSIISSNTLFHFTNTAENLISILKEGFKPRFCLETIGLEFMIGKQADEKQAVPMTCFCDLPFSMISDHLEFYGSYGIGLTKNWGKTKGLTPLIYIHDNSAFVKYIHHFGKAFFKQMIRLDHDTIPIDENPMVSFLELSAFLKPYEGEMWRVNKYVQKKFYDEREWRFVPFIDSIDSEYRLDEKQFLNNIERASANEMLGQRAKLDFDASDIKYIIVKSEIEMLALSNALDNMTTIYKPEEIKILRTKIISSEQIK